jgi:short-subunit dehydrogenase
MNTIAIVGMGPLVGLSIAREFGRRGYRVAMIARRRHALDAYAKSLVEEGIEAEGFPADASDREQLQAAFAAIQAKMGPIDVLEYSPTEWGNGKLYPPLETTTETALGHFKLLVLGAITAVEAVLPDMLARGKGTLLFATGTSAHRPHPFVTSMGISNAGVRNYALCLAEELAPRGIFVATLAIGVQVERNGTKCDPDRIAEVFWRLHEKQDENDVIYA